MKKLIDKLIEAGVESNEAKIELKMLAEFFCNYTELDKLKGRNLSINEYNLLDSKVKERIESKLPVQYIIGEAYFMNEYFKVNQNVLIPRDETEILVTECINLIKQNNLKTILDIGTGSGCIACSIAKNTDTYVLGVDISSDALCVALDNVTKLGINNKAVFRKSDLFNKIREEETFDMIVSNPPYISKNAVLSPEVLNEPHIALFADNDGLYFYEQIIKEAPKYLNKNGWLCFELGIGEAETVAKLLEKDFENIKIIKDLANIERVIIAKLKNNK